MKKINTMILSASLSSMIAVAGIFAPAVADQHGAIKAAVAHADRPEADVARDAGRKPADVLTFAGIEPGMSVLDINSAGGYYTEIMSHVVGGEGTVFAHNGKVYWEFMRKTVPARFGERLSNVVPLNKNSEAVDLPANSLDMAISVLAYHDYYFETEARTEPEDVQAALKSVLHALKPGGSYIIIDHEAADGTGPELGNSLHRINSGLVKKEMAAAGFEFVGASDVLANPDDSLNDSAFAPNIRGKTDRFILKFKKPE